MAGNIAESGAHVEQRRLVDFRGAERARELGEHRPRAAEEPIRSADIVERPGADARLHPRVVEDFDVAAPARDEQRCHLLGEPHIGAAVIDEGLVIVTVDDRSEHLAGHDEMVARDVPVAHGALE